MPVNWRNGVERWLVTLQRGWLLALIVVAPWLYGSTRSWAKLLVSEGLLLQLGLSLLVSLWRWRFPRVPALALGMSGLLLLQGWLMVWNAKQTFLPRMFLFQPRLGSIGWAPGAVDQATAWPQMTLVSGLLAAFWTAAELTSHQEWRRRLMLTMSLTGVGILLLGTVQYLTKAPAIFWNASEDTGTTFFATFRYHGNAGSFLNLVLPLIAGQMILAFRQRQADARTAFWALATLLGFTCAFINVSRAAMSITLALLLAGLLGIARKTRPWSVHKTALAFGAALALVIALVWAFGFQPAGDRWQIFFAEAAHNPRFLVYRTIAQSILPVSGWWGFGPGTFQICFPFFTAPLGNAVGGIWQYAHNDYLQGVMEWGLSGAVCWALLIFWGPAQLASRWRLLRRRWSSEAMLFAACSLLSLLGVFLHALVDFPLQIASLQLYTAVLLGGVWKIAYPGEPVRPRRAMVAPEKYRLTERPVHWVIEVENNP